MKLTLPLKFQGGDLVRVHGRKARVDEYDEYDDTYRVSYNETDFDWVPAKAVKSRGEGYYD